VNRRSAEPRGASLRSSVIVMKHGTGAEAYMARLAPAETPATAKAAA
jgi:hypothetical protein